jgi:hypothetical protein
MPGRKATFFLAAPLFACTPDVIEAPGDELADSESSDDEIEGDSSDTESGSSDSDTDSSTSETDTSTSDTSESDVTESDTDETATTETTEGPSDCFSNDDCELGNCVEGDCHVVASCKQLAELDGNSTLADGVFELDPDAEGPRPPYAAYCDMTTDGGGWTLVLKSDGNLETFRYASAQWTTPDPFQPEFPDLDRHEAKLTSYSTVPFDELRIGLEAPGGVDPAPLAIQWITLPVGGTSLLDAIAPGTLIPTMLGRDAWKAIIPGASLQLNCNLEGLNVMPSMDTTNSHVRIGIVANEQNDCNSTNSRLGIGGGGNKCNTVPNATGNFAGCMADNGDVNIIGFGAVLVR